MHPCPHRPGRSRTSGAALDPDLYADCLDCGALLWTHYHDYDGDGIPHYTSWRPAPIPVVLGAPESQRRVA